MMIVDALQLFRDLLRKEGAPTVSADSTLPTATNDEKHACIEILHGSLALLHDRLAGDQVQRQEAVEVLAHLRDGVAELLREWGPTS